MEIQNRDLEKLHPDQLNILDVAQREKLKELLLEKSKEYKEFEYLLNKSSSHFLAASCSASLAVHSCINRNKTLAIISAGLSYLLFKQMSIYNALFQAADPISSKLTAIAKKICDDYTLFKPLPLSNHNNVQQFPDFKRGFDRP